MNKVYTAQEVADKLKIKKSTVYDLIKRGELSSSKVGKQLRVSEEQLSQYLKGSECSASSAQSYDHQPESSLLKRDYLLHSSGLIISGQASPALDFLLNQLPTHPDNLPVLQSHMNTYNGLYSLYFEKVHKFTLLPLCCLLAISCLLHCSVFKVQASNLFKVRLKCSDHCPNTSIRSWWR